MFHEQVETLMKWPKSTLHSSRLGLFSSLHIGNRYASKPLEVAVGDDARGAQGTRRVVLSAQAFYLGKPVWTAIIGHTSARLPNLTLRLLLFRT